MSNYKLSDFVDVPTLIKTIRKKKKYSQATLARKIGLSCKAISSYENAINIPPLDTFIKILNIGGFALEIKEDIYKTPKKMELPNA